MSRLDNVYAMLPTWAQHGAVSAYGLYWHWLRLGPGYSRYVRMYATRERFSEQQWRDWQYRHLRQLLQKAASAVPYYLKTWTRSEKAAARAGQLMDLPLLEKAPLRSDPRAFLRQDVHPSPRLVFHTSGTTGTPIATTWTIHEIRNSIALREVRSARWAGVSFGQPRATFSGRLVEPDPESNGPFHRFNIVEHQVYLSPFHLRPSTARQYVEALRKHNVRWLTGYAVSYYLLAQFILEQGLEVPPIKAIITTSEKVTREMRTVMEQAYGCRVYEEYSTVENALFASECEFGRLHISPDAGIVEILRADGTACEPGEPGEVVTTCLMRNYQPLIRYRLGDVATWGTTVCPCGRHMPIIQEVVGRVEDVVIGPDGRQMVRFHGVFVNQPHVFEGQIVQKVLDRISVRIVPAPGFDESDRRDVIYRVQQRLGPEIEVIVELVKEIPRTKSGKFQAVISEIRQNQADAQRH